MDNILRNAERQAAIGDLDAEVRHLAGRRRSEVSGLTVACCDCKGRGHYKTMGEVVGIVKVTCGDCNGTGRVCFEWPERLALAAYCGSEAARRLLGWKETPHGVIMMPDRMMLHALDEGGGVEVTEPCPSDLSHLHVSFSDWLHRLSCWPDALQHAAVVAAKCALTEFERTICVIHGERFYEGVETCDPLEGCEAPRAPARAVEAARRYLNNPTPENRVAFETALEQCRDGVLWIASPPGGPIPPIQAIQAANKITDVRDAICAKLIEWVL